MSDLYWFDCTDSYEVACSIAQGGGIWPSMISVDATNLSGTITSDDARELAAMLERAADACDTSTARLREADQGARHSAHPGETAVAPASVSPAAAGVTEDRQT